MVVKIESYTNSCSKVRVIARGKAPPNDKVLIYKLLNPSKCRDSQRFLLYIIEIEKLLQADMVQGSMFKKNLTRHLYLRDMRYLFLLAFTVNGLKTNENFAVLGCNNAVSKKPELTISIKATYFNDNLSWMLDQACFKILLSHFHSDVSNVMFKVLWSRLYHID